MIVQQAHVAAFLLPANPLLIPIFAYPENTRTGRFTMPCLDGIVCQRLNLSKKDFDDQVNPVFISIKIHKEALTMNCPHHAKEADIHGAICQPCAEVAESYSQALSQSLSLKAEKNRVTVLSPCLNAAEKRYTA